MFKFIEVQITKKELYDWSLETLSEVFDQLNLCPKDRFFRFDFECKDDLETFRKNLLIRALAKKIKVRTYSEGFSLYVSKK